MKFKNMKSQFKVLTLICLLLNAGLLSAQAQEKGKQEFSIHIGGGTSNDFVNIGSSISSSLLTLGHITYKDSKSTPSVGVTYKYAIKNKWMILADAYYQSDKKNAFVANSKIFTQKSSYYTLGLGTDYHYVSNDWLQLYSGASVAYTLVHDKFSNTTANFKNGNQNSFNFHVNAIGLRVGKKLGASLELGFGYKGIANIGVSYQF